MALDLQSFGNLSFLNDGFDDDFFEGHEIPIFWLDDSDAAEEETWFLSLIDSIEKNDVKSVGEILSLFNEKRISIAKTFNHPKFNNRENTVLKGTQRKTVLMVAVEYNAHESLALLIAQIQTYDHAESEQLLNFTTQASRNDDKLAVLDILLDEPAYAKKVSSNTQLKQSIGLLMDEGARNMFYPLVFNPAYNNNVELVKFLVEERGADVNEGNGRFYATNLSVPMLEEYSEDIEPERMMQLKKTIAYLLEQGADITARHNDFIKRLLAFGGDELIEIIEPYKAIIDFQSIPPQLVWDAVGSFPAHQKCVLLMVRLLGMPVADDLREAYMTMVIMHGTDADVLFALNTLAIPPVLPPLSPANIKEVFSTAHEGCMAVKKGLIMKALILCLPIPKSAVGLYFNVLLVAGSDNELAFELGASESFARFFLTQANQNPFQFCQRLSQAKLIHSKMDELGLVDVAQQSPSKSIKRLFTFFGKPMPGVSPSFGSAVPKGSNVIRKSDFKSNGIELFNQFILEHGHLSLKEVLILMQVSKGFYGEVDVTPAPALALS